MNDPRKLEAEYDFVAIVDGLEQQERDGWAVSAGLVQTLSDLGVAVRQNNVSTRGALFAALQELRSDAESGSAFQLHLVIHGNADGIGFNPTGELVTWADLRGELRAINAAMKGQLVVNMSSCKGLHGVKIVEGEPYPFFGLVGPARDLEVDLAKRVNQRFYTLQAEGTDFNRIVEAVNAEFANPLNLVSAVGYDHRPESTGLKRA